MHWQVNVYALILISSALASLLVALYAWRRRPAPGALPLALLTLGAAEWSVGYALATGFDDLALRMLLAKAQYLGIITVPLGVMFLVLEYTGREAWLTRRNVILLSIVPLLTLVLAWTNEAHGLIWADAHVEPYETLYVLKLVYGPFFWLYTAYNYMVLLTANLLLLLSILTSPRLQRLQGLTILIGTLLPWMGNLMYLTGWNPFPYLDLTPFGYILSGVVVLWGLFRYRLLDIVPVARDRVVESMHNGLLVLDAQDRIVDLNPAMQRIVGVAASQAIGQPVDAILDSWPELIARVHSEADTRVEIALERDRMQCLYDLHVSPLTDHRGRLTGRLVVLHDATDRKRAEEALRTYANRQETMREIDQSILAARSAETIAMAVASRVRYLVPCQRVIVTEIVEQERIEKLAAEGDGSLALGVDVNVYRELVQDHSIRQGWVKGIEDISTLAARSSMQQALYDEGVRSYAVIPLFIQDALIGTLHLEATQPGVFTVEHINAAVEVAVLLAIGLRQARLYERAQKEIEERRRAEAALRQRTSELEIQNAELDAFAHTVAHDLKNPLGAVMGFADLLVDIDQGGEASRIDSMLVSKEIVESAEIMDRIIDSLLLLAGVRKQEVELERLDMGGIVARVQRTLAGLIERYQAEIVLPTRWPVVWGYEPWVAEVWINYISNAIKYGGNPPHVEMGAAAQPGGMVRFWVRDNGLGLSLEEQVRLFTPFERLSQVRVHGHGLGLSIVRRIVDKLGGEVGVESEPGQGSEFWFSLKGV